MSRALVRFAAATSSHAQSVWLPGSVGQAAARQSVTVGDLDGVDPGVVECAHDAGDALEGHPVPQRVHAVTQRHVLEEDPGHADTSWSGVLGHPLGDAQCCRGHDVEVAGVGGQVVRGALDLEEDGDLVADRVLARECVHGFLRRELR